ncbi:MAG TPA: carbamoyl phosphate synthase small subunit, partial [Acidimicrobiales bacterium]|nr:carbamoyl phosphate synthase small subunit [Acidimicrobiales bacterium]
MSPSAPARAPAHLVLADGQVFEGEAAGAARPVATGELVFNTALSGYQEIVTDPSYAGQVIAFTYPHLGNYGTNAIDDEAGRPACRGVVTRDLTETPSSWRSEEDLEAFLVRHGVPAVTGVDTRRLTRVLRDEGAMPCAFGTADRATLAEAARMASGTDGVDLVSEVTVAEPYRRGTGPFSVVAYDFGVKETMLRHLDALAQVTVVPASTPAEAVLERRPDGVFLSNGPGDPAALDGPTAAVAGL